MQNAQKGIAAETQEAYSYIWDKLDNAHSGGSHL